MKQEFPLWLGILFPILFLCFWALMLTVMAQFGWSKLAGRFRSDRPLPDGAQRFLWQSLTVGRKFGSPGYNGCINVWVDDQAIHLRPSLMFRIAHPLLRLNWRDVSEVEPRKMLVLRMVEVRMKQDVPPIVFSGRSGRAIAERWRAITGGSMA